MRWKIPAGVTLALALLVPAAPAVAQTTTTPRVETAASCPAVVVYTDLRQLITIDLDTASDRAVRVLAGQLFTAANANSLTSLAAALQTQLGATPDELRTFLQTNLTAVWSTDLRIAVGRTLTNAGTHVNAAAQQTLGTATIDAYLAYLNDGWYVARASDAGPVMVYTDVRTLVTIDLDTASDRAVRVLAGQILTAANANSLTTLAAALQTQLGGTPDELRTFLKTNLTAVWPVDLRIAVGRTMTNAGTHVNAAAQQTLGTATIDAYLAYLNHGLYVARASDCAI
jgi:hypothetical protein